MATISAIIVAIIPLIVYLMNKKSSDVKTLNSELEYVKNVIKTQADAYKIEHELQEREIRSLKAEVASLRSTLNDSEDKIKLMEGSIAKLIGKGCRVEHCDKRKAYTLEEINEVTKNNKKKNEKVNTRVKKQMAN